MKSFLIGIIVIILAAVGGYCYLQHNSSGQAPQTSFQTSSITRTGTLQKSNGSDYHHIIIGSGQSWGVTSQSVSLDQYVGKKVEATGQNSGTTLYIDTIKIIP
jgi:hypothetical protein